MNTALLAFGFIFGANVATTAVLMVHDTNNIRTIKKLHVRLKAVEAGHLAWDAVKLHNRPSKYDNPISTK